jgi:predicted PurR-regulated permease PerM
MHFETGVLVLLAALSAIICLATTTSTDVTELMNQQKDLEDKLENHMNTIEHQLKQIEWYLKVGYHNQDNLMMDDIDEFVSNPVNVYTMIKRTSKYWPHLKNQLFNDTANEEWDNLFKQVQSIAYATSRLIETPEDHSEL